MRKRWNPHEIEKLKELAETFTVSQISKLINRSHSSVANFAERNGIVVRSQFLKLESFGSYLDLARHVYENKFLPNSVPGENGCIVVYPEKMKRNGYSFAIACGIKFSGHRVSLEIKLGKKLGRKELACHHCDNPACINPDHLFLGDHKANAVDMTRKGRAHPLRCPADRKSRGENQHSSKLKAEDVVSIRNRHSSGESLRSLSRFFGVSLPSIKKVVSRMSWAHITTGGK